MKLEKRLKKYGLKMEFWGYSERTYRLYKAYFKDGQYHLEAAYGIDDGEAVKWTPVLSRESAEQLLDLAAAYIGEPRNSWRWSNLYHGEERYYQVRLAHEVDIDLEDYYGSYYTNGAVIVKATSRVHALSIAPRQMENYHGLIYGEDEDFEYKDLRCKLATEEDYKAWMIEVYGEDVFRGDQS